MFDDYISLDEVLKECGCCKRTIERWQEKKGFPRGFMTPKGLIFSKKKVLAWLKAQDRAVSSEGF